MLFLHAAERFPVNLLDTLTCLPFALECAAVLVDLVTLGLVAFGKGFPECGDFIDRCLFFSTQLIQCVASGAKIGVPLLQFGVALLQFGVALLQLGGELCIGQLLSEQDAILFAQPIHLRAE